MKTDRPKESKVGEIASLTDRLRNSSELLLNDVSKLTDVLLPILPAYKGEEGKPDGQPTLVTPLGSSLFSILGDVEAAITIVEYLIKSVQL